MAKGKKFNDDIKEKALAMLATNNNTSEVAKTLGIKESTLRSWRSDPKNDEFAKLRQKKKKEFVESAWDIIEKTQKLLRRRISRALEQEDEIDELLDKAMDELDDEKSENDRTNFKKRQRITGKIDALKLDSISQLSTTLGTLYDKQALAVDEPTVNVGGNLEDLIKKVEDKSEY